MSQTQELPQQSRHPDACCSFCREPRSNTGPIVEGPETGGMSLYICRDCAELAVEIIDEEERRRRGEKATRMTKSTVKMIGICVKTLDYFESLSRQRELTKIELGRKQQVESELKELQDET